MSAKSTGPSLARLVETARVVVACGPGGVGKTTAAAALALGVALRMEKRVLVLTIDPARRLADALGLPPSGNEVITVGSEFFAALGKEPKGTLSVAMLDASVTWDALIRRTAASKSDAEEIIANPLYKNLTARFARGHEFIAMERLYELDQSGDFDLMILDTPPSSMVRRLPRRTIEDGGLLLLTTALMADRTVAVPPRQSRFAALHVDRRSHPRHRLPLVHRAVLLVVAEHV